MAARPLTIDLNKGIKKPDTRPPRRGKKAKKKKLASFADFFSPHFRFFNTLRSLKWSTFIFMFGGAANQIRVF